MIVIKICIPEIESFNKCQRAKTIKALALALAGDRAELIINLLKIKNINI